MAVQTFTAVIHKEDNLYVAEAIANLKEATELYLEEFPMREGAIDAN